MRIEDRVEVLVRAALDAAVRRDRESLDAALRSFPDDDAARQGVELAVAIVAYVMFDVYRGRPTEEHIRTVAREIAEAESWAGCTADEIATFLSHGLAGRPLSGALPHDAVIILMFVVPATLLSAFRGKDELWEDYLDRAEAAIESDRQARGR